MNKSRRLPSNRVFVDTSAYFAAANSRDANHQSASAVMEGLVVARRPLFTTNFIVAELHGLLLNRLNRYTAARVLSEIDESRATTVVHVSARDERRAREIVFGYTDKDFSLVDAISFAAMERLHISQAFAFDQNVAQYGWQLLDRETMLKSFARCAGLSVWSPNVCLHLREFASRTRQ